MPELITVQNSITQLTQYHEICLVFLVNKCEIYALKI